jgi:transcriptional regulator with XRE-family HTH domain
MLVPCTPELVATTMAPDEQQFLKALGARITKLRKEQGLSQQSVADTLGMAQQSYAHYEVGRVRMPVWMLPRISQLFGVSVEELVGTPIRRAGKRGPTPRLQQQIERLSDLPPAKQKVVMEMLDGVLSQSGR